jgi:hypothetical protein
VRGVRKQMIKNYLEKVQAIHERYPINKEQFFKLVDIMQKYDKECWDYWADIAEVLYGGIGGGLTYDEIGIVMGLTRERIRQILNKVLTKISINKSLWSYYNPDIKTFIEKDKKRKKIK